MGGPLAPPAGPGTQGRVVHADPRLRRPRAGDVRHLLPRAPRADRAGAPDGRQPLPGGGRGARAAPWHRRPARQRDAVRAAVTPVRADRGDDAGLHLRLRPRRPLPLRQPPTARSLGPLVRGRRRQESLRTGLPAVARRHAHARAGPGHPNEAADQGRGAVHGRQRHLRRVRVHLHAHPRPRRQRRGDRRYDARRHRAGASPRQRAGRAGRGGTCRPDEGRVPRHAQSRAAHAAQRHPRLVSDPDEGKRPRPTSPKGCGRSSGTRGPRSRSSKTSWT